MKEIMKMDEIKLLLIIVQILILSLQIIYYRDGDYEKSLICCLFINLISIIRIIL